MENSAEDLFALDVVEESLPQAASEARNVSQGWNRSLGTLNKQFLSTWE
jgi:hypothetical protein